MVASMDGIVYHNLHSQPLCITPSSLTHKRGLKRSAPDSDDLQRPTADNHHALSQLPADKQIVMHCKTGVRSAETLAIVKGAGYADAVHVGGGVVAWVNQIDPSQPSY